MFLTSAIKTKNPHPVSDITLDFFANMFQNSTFDGYINICIRNEHGVFSNLGFVRINQLLEYIAKMCVYPSCDYYVSANSFCKPERLKENLFSFNNIVLDIDRHDGKYYPHKLSMLIEKLVWRLQNDCFTCENIPTPNYVVLTGRGIQLWWALVPSYAAAFNKNITDIRNHFISVIKCFLNEFESELGMFDVDNAASSKSEGLFRLPGSFNSKAGQQVETIHLNNSMLDPKEYRDRVLPITVQKTSYSKRSCTYIPSDLQARIEHRIAAITHLRALRSAPAGSETRNNYCYVLYSLMKAIYGHEEAYQRTAEFNEGFLHPLTSRELKSTLSSAVRKNYKFSNEKLMEILDITDSEARLIGLYKFVSQKSSIVSSKAHRDRKIIELYNQGLSQVAIAEKVGADNFKEEDRGDDCRSTALVRISETKAQTTSDIHKTEEISDSEEILNTLLNDYSTQELCDFKPFFDGVISFRQNDIWANIKYDAAIRIEAALLSCLQSEESRNGNMCIETETLFSKLSAYLRRNTYQEEMKLSNQQYLSACTHLLEKGYIVHHEVDGLQYCYLKTNYYIENQTIQNMLKLLQTPKSTAVELCDLEKRMLRYEQENSFSLSSEQKLAIFTAINAPISIITGGPGTGKTTVTHGLCSIVRELSPNCKIKLCAPTGKAAVRLAETTSLVATTVHSLLTCGSINCDYLIIDESSMLDMALFHTPSSILHWMRP